MHFYPCDLVVFFMSIHTALIYYLDLLSLNILGGKKTPLLLPRGDFSWTGCSLSCVNFPHRINLQAALPHVILYVGNLLPLSGPLGDIIFASELLSLESEEQTFSPGKKRQMKGGFWPGTGYPTFQNGINSAWKVWVDERVNSTEVRFSAGTPSVTACFETRCDVCCRNSWFCRWECQLQSILYCSFASTSCKNTDSQTDSDVADFL